MLARRNALQPVARQSTTHAGLWLDKYLTDQTGENQNGGDAEAAKTAKTKLLTEVAGLGVPDGYVAARKRRLEAMQAPGGESSKKLVLATAKCLGRAVVGLGQKGPTEIGIALEHTWGTPVLPGSSLKGLAAAAAHLLFGGEEWSKAPEGGRQKPNSFDVLFGTTDEAGAVEFLDAWWSPEGKPLELDVMTVHHPDYYQAVKEPPAPSDFDSPNPVSFLTTSGSFQVILEGPPAWVERAFELLKAGLAELGLGAKTNAGYGRFELERVLNAAELAEEQRLAETRRSREADARLLRSLPNAYQGIQNATQIFEPIRKAAGEPALEAVLGDVVTALLALPNARQVWRRWRGDARRTEDERRVFDTWFAPRLA